MDSDQESAYYINLVILIETVLLSTHNICFGWEIRKIFDSYTILLPVA